MESLDLANQPIREINQYFHQLDASDTREIEIHHPNGAHNIAVGLNAPVKVHIHGHAGYFIAGMNKQAEIIIHGNVGWSVAENMMSGVVRVNGFASECAGASGHSGLLIIKGDASSRCGISMKGCNIVVGGNVGHMSAFMAQAGYLLVCGDADHGLGDSLYEAVIYIRGKIHGLGADAREESMNESDYAKVNELLEMSEFKYDPQEFKRVASAKTLYHWSPNSISSAVL